MIVNLNLWKKSEEDGKGGLFRIEMDLEINYESRNIQIDAT